MTDPAPPPRLFNGRPARQLPQPTRLRDCLVESLSLALTGTWEATHALPQRAVPTHAGENVTVNVDDDERPVSVTYRVDVGAHPALDRDLARAALALRGRAGARQSSNPSRYALVGAGTRWDEDGWTHWLAGGGGGTDYRLYRHPAGLPQKGPGSVPAELLATVDKVELETAVRDALADALRDGIRLARIGAAEDWAPLATRPARSADTLASRADAARDDVRAAQAALAAATADLRAMPDANDEARDALRGSVAAAGDDLRAARSRAAALEEQVAARGPAGTPPGEIACELDLLLAGLAMLGPGRPLPAQAVRALHTVVRLRLRPARRGLAARFDASVLVLADDGLYAELGPVHGTVRNRAIATAPPAARAGGRRRHADANRDNAARRREGHARVVRAAAAELMLTDVPLAEVAPFGKPGARRAATGGALAAHVRVLFRGMGLSARAAALVVDDPVCGNRAAVWRALTGEGPQPADPAYAAWIVALYTAAADLAHGPAATAHRDAVAVLPRALLRHLHEIASLRGGEPLPAHPRWARPSAAAEAALSRAAAGLPAPGRYEPGHGARLHEARYGWPATVVAASGGRGFAPLPCPHGTCGPNGAASLLSRTATSTAGVLCPACRRMPVEGSPMFPEEHVAALSADAVGAWRASRRPDAVSRNQRARTRRRRVLDGN